MKVCLFDVVLLSCVVTYLGWVVVTQLLSCFKLWFLFSVGFGWVACLFGLVWYLCFPVLHLWSVFVGYVIDVELLLWCLRFTFGFVSCILCLLLSGWLFRVILVCLLILCFVWLLFVGFMRPWHRFLILLWWFCFVFELPFLILGFIGWRIACFDWFWFVDVFTFGDCLLFVFGCSFCLLFVFEMFCHFVGCLLWFCACDFGFWLFGLITCLFGWCDA